ncbi:unnamed protein product [Lactuca virosa]|uniref:Uncharacterized protein n=1 Tax=Lactuca virosa TaxID=75947 RepID=A0AAU9PE97_9ASTR|nr:unnamed protein product [Lactuca virosa]
MFSKTRNSNFQIKSQNKICSLPYSLSSAASSLLSSTGPPAAVGAPPLEEATTTNLPGSATRVLIHTTFVNLGGNVENLEERGLRWIETSVILWNNHIHRSHKSITRRSSELVLDNFFTGFLQVSLCEDQAGIPSNIQFSRHDVQVI